jgi:hypothetical protein
MINIRPKLKVKRQVRRRRHQLAWITLEGAKKRHECSVEDVSRQGAKISVDSTIEIEGQFGIAFVPQGASRRCEVAWRRGNMLGIKFVG